MKGTIKVKSKQGQGTEFTVSFTFRIQDEADKKQAIPQWKGQKALIISEDLDSGRNMSRMLVQLGMSTSSTNRIRPV